MTNIPRRIGKFEILDRLGEGAMGEVFLARDTLLGREVAIKTIQPAALTAPDAHDRFFREAQATARLNHPNLVTIFEFGEDQGTLYMAMEFVPGDDLVQLIRTRELGTREMLELLAQVCDGLAFAHQRGVLHRDIKPSNIRVTRLSGRLTAKVLDFGIARLAGSDLTSTGTLMGTFGYMAPEYIQSGKPDARSDLFAVGVILYEVLAGTRPFGGESTATVLHRILNEEPPPLDPAMLEGISPAIQDVLARALAKNPAHRYAGADLLAAALRGAREPSWTPGGDKEVTVRSSRSFELPGRNAPPPAPGKPFAKAWLFALLTPVLLAGAAFGGWKWLRHRRRPVPVPVAVQPAPVVLPPPPAQADLQPASQEPPKLEMAKPETAKPEPGKAEGAKAEAAKPSVAKAEPAKPAAAKPEPPRTAAAPAKPAAETPKPKYANINEAATALDTDPKGALVYFNDLAQKEPENDRAIALRIVALYDTGDYKACGKAMYEARTAGHPIWPLALKYPRLRKMLEQERADPRLPKRKAAPGAADAP